jgi:hypothetical protein
MLFMDRLHCITIPSSVERLFPEVEELPDVAEEDLSGSFVASLAGLFSLVQCL